mmetsp:Transcript_67877/g.191329  ORF Transcript_67877/g.191329 Transcript_67877/m.191329 type:complete len:324 (+) Transcript_67877:77-1048(+)
MAVPGASALILLALCRAGLVGALHAVARPPSVSQHRATNGSMAPGALTANCTPFEREQALMSMSSSGGERAAASPHKCTIALLIPTIGNETSARNLNTVLESVLSTRSGKCTVGAYIAHDAEDGWYKQPSKRAEVTESNAARALDIRFVVNYGNRTFVDAVNAAAVQAVVDGYNYLYQIGDDIKFLTPKWDELFEQAIIDMGYIGVVGPAQSIMNPKPILQESFVSREHVCMFGYYFPHRFLNWYTDNWITQAYNYTGRARQIAEVLVDNMDVKRYYGDRDAESVWEAEAERAHCRTLAAAITQPALWNCIGFIARRRVRARQ